MINFSNSLLQNIVIHKIGNQSEEEELEISKAPLTLENDYIKDLLVQYFLYPFKTPEYYHLDHASDINLNEIYTYASRIFDNPFEFYIQSIHIAKHLYEQSTHPKIKSGELYITYFTECKIDNEVTDAIGIFKSETKETFLKVFPNGENNYDVNYEDGININKLDKGVIIFNTDKEKGYKLAIVDATNKSEAQYWRDDFLNLKVIANDFHHTKNLMNMTKSFVTQHLQENFEIEKADTIDLLNRSAKFFKDQETFDVDEFSNTVFRQPEVIEAFNGYKEKYQNERDMQIADVFDINQMAVKKQAKVFKSILKLDKNFHVYIHGDRDKIEKGYDEESGLNFYKLYFKEEA